MAVLRANCIKCNRCAPGSNLETMQKRTTVGSRFAASFLDHWCRIESHRENSGLFMNNSGTRGTRNVVRNILTHNG